MTTPDVVAVIDQAFPADTRARLESLLPKLMAVYDRELGALKSPWLPGRWMNALRAPCARQ